MLVLYISHHGHYIIELTLSSFVLLLWLQTQRRGVANSGGPSSLQVIVNALLLLKLTLTPSVLFYPTVSSSDAFSQVEEDMGNNAAASSGYGFLMRKHLLSLFQW